MKHLTGYLAALAIVIGPPCKLRADEELVAACRSFLGVEEDKRKELSPLINTYKGDIDELLSPR